MSINLAHKQYKYLLLFCEYMGFFSDIKQLLSNSTPIL